MDKLPLPTQTLYAELIEQLVALEARRSVGHLPGCFVTKTIKGERYAYFQYSSPGGTTSQLYIGKMTPLIEAVVTRFAKERAAREVDALGIARLCAQLRAGGANTTDHATGRVLKALSDGGVFHLDGVLVGTTAFTVIGNLLGVRWHSGLLRTQDIDLAGGPVVSVGVPQLAADIPALLDSLNMGFLPVPPFDRAAPSTSFKVRGSALRVDLLTPATGSRSAPRMIARFGAAAQQVKHLDYLLEGFERGVIVDGGGVLVNVPSPARFALHKLVVAQMRSAGMHDKVEKDLLQAADLLEVLSEERPGDLSIAWDTLKAKGTPVRYVVASLARLATTRADLCARVRGILRIRQAAK